LSLPEEPAVESGSGSTAWRLACLGTAAVFAAATLFYAAEHWQDNGKANLIQAAGLLLAVLLALSLARPLFVRATLSRSKVRWPVALAALALLLTASGLRFLELRTLPYPMQACFEEMKKAGAAFRVVQGGPLPLEFRYTEALGALGLSRGGDPLDALRLPFRINGCAGLLFLLLCLRALEVSMLPAAFVTLGAATLPWLSFGGGVADESFAGMTPSLALLWMLAQSERSPSRSASWAAGAGILGGVLCYEYVSFQASILLAGGWLAFRAVVPRVPSSEPRPWLPLAAFLAAFALVAAPALANLLHAPSDSALLDGLIRHRAGRTTTFVADTASNLSGYLRALFGLTGPAVECLAIMRQPMIPAALGLLLAAAWIAALLRPRLPLERFLALGAGFSVAVAAALANNFNPQRVTATLSLLLLLAGTLLERAGGGLRRRLGPAAGALAILVPAAILSAVNLRAIGQIEANERARDCWVNDDYVMARHIADAGRPGQQVWVWTPQFPRYNWSHPDEAWLFATKKLQVVSVEPTDVRRSLPPDGTLVAVGYRSGTVSSDDIRWLVGLAGDSSSLSVSRNLAGRAAAASVCVRCGP
jgi:hypothetical protein